MKTILENLAFKVMTFFILSVLYFTSCSNTNLMNVRETDKTPKLSIPQKSNNYYSEYLIFKTKIDSLYSIYNTVSLLNNEEDQTKLKEVAQSDMEGAKNGWNEGSMAGATLGVFWGGITGAGTMSIVGGLVGALVYGVEASVNKALQDSTTQYIVLPNESIVEIQPFNDFSAGNLGYYHNFIISYLYQNNLVFPEMSATDLMYAIFNSIDDLYGIQLSDEAHSFFISDLYDFSLGYEIDNENVDMDIITDITNDYISALYNVNEYNRESFTYNYMSIVESSFGTETEETYIINGSISVGYYSSLLWSIEEGEME